MAINDLMSNIQQEKKILREIMFLYNKLGYELSADEATFFKNAISALFNKIRIINNAVPTIISDIGEEKPAEKKRN